MYVKDNHEGKGHQDGRIKKSRRPRKSISIMRIVPNAISKINIIFGNASRIEIILFCQRQRICRINLFSWPTYHHLYHPPLPEPSASYFILLLVPVFWGYDGRRLLLFLAGEVMWLLGIVFVPYSYLLSDMCRGISAAIEPKGGFGKQ